MRGIAADQDSVGIGDGVVAWCALRQGGRHLFGEAVLYVSSLKAACDPNLIEVSHNVRFHTSSEDEK